MYGFMLRPDTIPRSYETWYVTSMHTYETLLISLSSRIQKASIVPVEAVSMNRQLVNERRLDVGLLERLANGGGKLWNGATGSVSLIFYYISLINSSSISIT